MNQQIREKEPWKKKESRLSKKAAKQDARGLIERAAMEEQANRKIRFQVLSWAIFKRDIKRAKSFIVYLDEPLSIQQIQENIEKGFGMI